MRPSRLATLTLVVAAAAVLPLSGCVSSPGPTPTCQSMELGAAVPCEAQPDVEVQGVAIESVTYSQFQSTPDFDTTTYVVEGEAAIAALARILEDSDVGLSDYATDVSQVAPGALESTVSIEWADGHASTITVTSIDGASEFETAFGDLVTSWHDEGIGEALVSP